MFIEDGVHQRTVVSNPDDPVVAGLEPFNDFYRSGIRRLVGLAYALLQSDPVDEAYRLVSAEELIPGENARIRKTARYRHVGARLPPTVTCQSFSTSIRLKTERPELPTITVSSTR